MKKSIQLFLSLLFAISLNAQTPTVIIQTAKIQGSPLTLQLRLASPGKVAIDWGNGVKENYSVETESTEIKGLLSGNTVKLYANELSFIKCSDNNITDIDVSGAIELQQLYCDKNDLTTLDVSCNAKLTRLGCPSNKLTSLNIRKNSKLSGLYIQNNMFDACGLNQVYNDLMARRDESSSINLRVIGNPGALNSNTTIAKEKKWNIDVVGNNSGCNPIVFTTSKKIGDAITFELRLVSNGNVLIDWGKGVQKIDVSTESTRIDGVLEAGNTIKIYGDNLTFIKCEKNGLTNIDISGAKLLQQLYCGYNNIKSVDVSNSVKLTRLGCNNNDIEVLNLKSNSKLSGLYLQNNKLSACSLNDIFNQIPSRTNTQSNVNLRVIGNPGATNCNTTIASLKNWVVDTKGDNTGCSSNK